MSDNSLDDGPDRTGDAAEYDPVREAGVERTAVSGEADPTHGWVERPEADAGVVLELDGVDKRYGPTTVIDDLSLSVRDGELLTLVGPSGCGKTTTLRLIAGLERPDAGEIRIDGETIATAEESVPPEDRDVGIVFQEFALFPHMTAEENVAFGLSEWSADERDARVEELLDLVGLREHRDSYPDELSGGQQQRVALARSLAPEPETLLLDEPFSNLDVDLREEMREEVRAILKEAGVTAVSVTHDQEEALAISDRIAVVRDGRIEQIGRPDQVFQHPESRFVAGFLGHASFVPGNVTERGVETDLGAIDLDRVYGLTDDYAWSTVDVLVRPDDVAARPVPEAEADGRVVGRQYLGPTVMYRVELDTGDVVECMHNHTERIDPGAHVALELEADHDLAWFPREGAGEVRSEGGDAPDPA
jgi:iron(III) transport system ATP-binding protein